MQQLVSLNLLLLDNDIKCSYPIGLYHTVSVRNAEVQWPIIFEPNGIFQNGFQEETENVVNKRCAKFEQIRNKIKCLKFGGTKASSEEEEEYEIF